jgi:biopolymer transport protein ExbD
MRTQGRLVTRIAIILILLGITLPAAYRRWLDTRTFVALDIPVSFAPGHIRTVDFGVNITGWYHIGIGGDEEFFYRTGCRFGAFDPLLKTRSIVYRDGRAGEIFDGTDRYVGHFYGEKHERYRLDIQVLTDASCLDGGHPRVFVWTPSADYELRYNQLLAFSVCLVLGGLGVLAFSTTSIVGKQMSAHGQLPMVGNVGYAYYPSRRKLPLKLRLSRLPPFGLVYAVILAAALIPTFLIFLYAWGYDRRSVGIEVHLANLGPLKAAADSWTKPLVVRIENASAGSPPRLYLNSKAIAWEALGPALKGELKSRPDWVIYVEADRDVNWGDAVNAMGIIRGVGANVVLLTTEPTASPANPRHARQH